MSIRGKISACVVSYPFPALQNPQQNRLFFIASVKMRGLYDFYGAVLVLSVFIGYICTHEHEGKYRTKYGKSGKIAGFAVRFFNQAVCKVDWS